MNNKYPEIAGTLVNNGQAIQNSFSAPRKGKILVRRIDLSEMAPNQIRAEKWFSRAKAEEIREFARIRAQF